MNSGLQTIVVEARIGEPVLAFDAVESVSRVTTAQLDWYLSARKAKH